MKAWRSGLGLLLVALAFAPRVGWAAGKAGEKTGEKRGDKNDRTGARAASGAHAAPAAKGAKVAPKPAVAEKPPAPRGRVAVLGFTGEWAEPVQRAVVRVLQGRGLRMLYNIRSVDSPSQFREMADSLKVFAYVSGEMEMQGALISATVTLRSGATGLRVASATYSGERKKVVAELSKGLWEAFLPALSRASADSRLPHEHEAPMRIDAGSPIENSASDDAVVEPQAPAPASTGVVPAAAGKPGPS